MSAQNCHRSQRRRRRSEITLRKLSFLNFLFCSLSGSFCRPDPGRAKKSRKSSCLSRKTRARFSVWDDWQKTTSIMHSHTYFMNLLWDEIEKKKLFPFTLRSTYPKNKLFSFASDMNNLCHRLYDIYCQIQTHLPFHRGEVDRSWWREILNFDRVHRELTLWSSGKLIFRLNFKWQNNFSLIAPDGSGENRQTLNLNENRIEIVTPLRSLPCGSRAIINHIVTTYASLPSFPTTKLKSCREEIMRRLFGGWHRVSRMFFFRGNTLVGKTISVFLFCWRLKRQTLIQISRRSFIHFDEPGHDSGGAHPRNSRSLCVAV